MAGLTLLVAASAARACPGDCDQSGTVTVDEIVTLISIALGSLPVTSCPPGDLDGDGAITVDEIVRALDATLSGCPLASVTPTPVVTATPTPVPPTDTPAATFTATMTPTSTPTVTPTLDPNQPIVRSYDFRNGEGGWSAGFADYPLGQEEMFDFVAELAPIPPETGSAGTAFLLAGTNRSDDLFMYLVRRLGPEDGVQPGKRYTVTFNLRYASNAPSGCVGIGGAPGESVYLKAGAGGAAPATVVEDEWVRMSVDKGNQAQGGPAAAVVGNIANGLPCEDVDLSDPPYVTKVVNGFSSPHLATASANGEIWLLVGTDSGFEGRTALYYQRIGVSLTPVRD